MLTRKFWIGICVFLFLVAGLLALVYRSATTGPFFYREAQKVAQDVNNRNGEELENGFLNAHNAAVREDQWSIELSDQQLNGWIATHLAKKYSRYYPNQIENLCTSFESEKIHVAFKVKSGWLPVVVSIRAKLFMTSDEKNIALRLEHIGTGWIPFPKKNATERITKAMQRSDISILWTTEQGKPLGLLPVQFDLAKKTQRRLTVQSIVVQDRKLVVSGSAENIE